MFTSSSLWLRHFFFSFYYFLTVETFLLAALICSRTSENLCLYFHDSCQTINPGKMRRLSDFSLYFELRKFNVLKKESCNKECYREDQRRKSFIQSLSRLSFKGTQCLFVLNSRNCFLLIQLIVPRLTQHRSNE